MVLNQLEESNIHIEVSGDRYVYNNISVPRVTEILSAMLHEEYLMKWANNLGFKRKGYMTTLNQAADKGTYTHLSIEHYLRDGKEPDYESLPFFCIETVRNTFGSFMSWWQLITSMNEVEIVFQEKKMCCQWFGGTLDALIRINDKLWLVDFKSSNHPSYKYFLQLSAYRYMLRLEGIDIDGCLVLMLDKTKIKFIEQIVNFGDADGLKFIEDCEETFMSLLYAYYRRMDIENQYKKIIRR